ncbi:ABC transporter ATP-binding protein [Actinosynnema sp. NPDC053489]|uniref:ABC transporter ATP-binding protein n=1 Tax=Actinosynnema sp. NPDC053489 TaxID=3363916 RepID=UPI0037C8FEBF
MAAPRSGKPNHNRKKAVLLALRLYLRELGRHRHLGVGGLVLPALGNTCLLYLAPLAVGALAGHLAGGGDTGPATVLRYVLVFAGLMLLAELLWRIGIHCLNRTDARGIEHLSTLGMDALLAKDAAFFHDNFAGSLTKRVISFASRFEQFVDALAFSVVANLIPLGFACVVLWTYDPLLVVVLLGLIAVTGFAVAPLVRRRQHLVDEREAAYARVSGHVADTLANMETVRAFAAEDREGAEHRSRAAESRALALRSWDYGNLRIDTVVAPLSVLTNALGLALAVGISDGLGVEAIVVTFAYFTNATRIMFEFNQIYRRVEGALTEAAQFTELLLDEPTVLDPEDPQPLRVRDARVRFDGVVFGHGDDKPLFTGLDLDIPAGTRVGLVGRSGGGKTTLTRLVLRLMDVDEGRILIGDQDIANLRQADLRGLIAYVPQEPAMFHRTLRENIAFARPGASDEDVLRAARAAHVTEFAESLPDGFDTMVGERGIKLSGGQRQRVALARAILRDAPVLLLDEATSALDSESEVLVQEALWRLMEGRTALVVAHRLSTVVRMDRLIVLDRGRVVEQGTHAELLDLDGTYARLWRHQSGGFLEEAMPDEVGADEVGADEVGADEVGADEVGADEGVTGAVGAEPSRA